MCWNHARMTERSFVNGSFVVRIFLVKRFFELALTKKTQHFKVKKPEAHTAVSFHALFWWEIVSVMFSHQFPPPNPGRHLQHGKFHLIQTLWIQPRGRPSVVGLWETPNGTQSSGNHPTSHLGISTVVGKIIELRHTMFDY